VDILLVDDIVMKFVDPKGPELLLPLYILRLYLTVEFLAVEL